MVTIPEYLRVVNPVNFQTVAAAQIIIKSGIESEDSMPQSGVLGRTAVTTINDPYLLIIAYFG